MNGPRHIVRSGTFITAALLFISLQFPSLRDIHKFLPAESVWLGYVYLAAMSFAYFRILGAAGSRARRGLVGLLDSRALFFAASIVLLAATAALYPHIDGLKHIGMGSDQDDSMTTGGLALLRGENPYATLVPIFDNPRSPGPGWLVLNLP